MIAQSATWHATPTTRVDWAQWEPPSGLKQSPLTRLQVGERNTLEEVHAQAEDKTAEIFNCLVDLKVDCSYLAMHLTSDEHHKIFEELDTLMAEENWDHEDVLPQREAFRNFLKWTIYAKNKTWDSLGISNDGSTLVAWVRSQQTLTACFEKQSHVSWSWRQTVSNEELNFASGVSSLKEFVRQSDFYLGDTKE